MNQKQIIMRDFIEHITLEKLDYDNFQFIQNEIRDSVFKNDDYIKIFCNYFNLGSEFAEIMDLIEFPFLEWWNEYCEEFEQECEENSREESERYDDYQRIIGAR